MPDDNSSLVPPDPISNSEVKRTNANGSAGLPCVRVGNRQAFYLGRAFSDLKALFFCYKISFMELQEISDRMEIEKLVTNYASAVDQKQFHRFRDFFTPDCFIDYRKVGGISGTLEEIISYLESALKHFPNYQHMISNISIDFDESNNSAIGKVMCFNPMEDKKGKVFFLGMWYNDKYQRTKDGWKISERIEESSWSLNAPINTK